MKTILIAVFLLAIFVIAPAAYFMGVGPNAGWEDVGPAGYLLLAAAGIGGLLFFFFFIGAAGEGEPEYSRVVSSILLGCGILVCASNLYIQRSERFERVHGGKAESVNLEVGRGPSLALLLGGIFAVCGGFGVSKAPRKDPDDLGGNSLADVILGWKCTTGCGRRVGGILGGNHGSADHPICDSCYEIESAKRKEVDAKQKKLEAPFSSLAIKRLFEEYEYPDRHSITTLLAVVGGYPEADIDRAQSEPDRMKLLLQCQWRQGERQSEVHSTWMEVIRVGQNAFRSRIYKTERED